LVLYNAEGWLPSQPYRRGVLRPTARKKKDASKPKQTKPLTALSDKSDLALANTLYALVIGTCRLRGY
jgi:hypothetical protein